MDQTPTAPMSPFPPPTGESVVEVSPTTPLPDTRIVIGAGSGDADPSDTRDHLTARLDSLSGQFRAVGLAIMAGLALGAAWFVALGAIVFVFADRGFWDEQLHLITDYWYVFTVLAAAAVAPMLLAIRDGRATAVGFLFDRGYWKVLLVTWLIVPVLVAVTVFVATNLIAVLVTAIVIITVLLVLVFTVGGV